MRKLLISILLAGAAASPAFAQDQDHGRWHHDQAQSDNNQQSQRHEERVQPREERSQTREERPRFEMRQQQFEARQQQVQTEQVQAQQQQRNFDRRQRADGVSRWNRDNVQQAGETARWTRDPNQRAGEAGRWTRDRTGWTGSNDAQRQYEQRSQYQYRQRQYQNQQQRQVSQRSRWANGGWNREWHNNARYDWRRYRNNHRSIFHLGVYVDPFGFGYRPFNIGYNLGPAYYGQQYWIDPAMYSLPYPPPGTQWVRYWNDALLVDVYSGEIVDVIQNFFW